MENKFDHRTFALKQIKIHPKEDLDKVLKEVENLSKVKTKNVTMIFEHCLFLNVRFRYLLRFVQTKMLSSTLTVFWFKTMCAEKSRLL